MSLTREAIAAMDEPIRELIARCKAMPRGPKRSKLGLELGKMLKKQDAFIREEMERQDATDKQLPAA